ncbi:hypothetical protein PBI_ZOEJ_44 [Mycobacterium phage ZoeJ]|uniref:Uncharacterized protein n=1 Tax=Mycobacterium phage ZoeJ TaxID=1486427 RepID=A0A023W737_9CAUD|nr:hypothetical protein PBI_ZOEJ_44 [Mycobacterium phage ZoeJ]AHY26868.1 hypothetical protein PBI_ZOEJ_44 [Mycobacterium phage ZoeJ]
MLPDHVTLVLLRVLAFAIIAGAIWYRRHTWRMRWEGGITLQLALQLVAMWLCAPGTDALARYVHLPELVGVHQVETFLGNCVFLGAVAVVAANMLTRIADDDNEAQALVQQRLLPIVSAAPALMLGCLVSSQAPLHEALDLFDVHPDGWLRAYWCIYFGALIAVVSIALWALNIIADDPAQRAVARIWQAALWCGAVGCVVGLINAFVAAPLGWAIWYATAAEAVTCAVLAARSWRIRMRPYRGLLAATRTTQRELRADTVEAHRLRVGALAQAPQRHDGHAAS